MSEKITQSKNHLAFIGNFEYYQVDNDVYRAAISSVVMPDGKRAGRFECPLFLWETAKKIHTNTSNKSK